MTNDLRRLGLQPEGDHPDAELLDLLHVEGLRHEAWTQCKTEAERGRWLKTVANEGEYLPKQEEIARAKPTTLLGLLAKCDHALHTWRELAGNKHGTMWAGPATALEQAVAILSKLTEAELQEIRRRR